MAASGDISIDSEAASATATAWRAYADQLEQHAASHVAAMGDAIQTLGDVYADYKDAVQQRLIPEFVGAHQRVANRARLHASRLEATTQAFGEQDANSAASVKNSVSD
jgi:hypothetical protein